MSAPVRDRPRGLPRPAPGALLAPLLGSVSIALVLGSTALLALGHVVAVLVLLGVLIGGGVVVLACLRVHAAMLLTLVLAFVSVPGVIPTTFDVSGFSVGAYEPLLVICAVRLLFSPGRWSLSAGATLPVLLVIVVWSIGGLVGRNPVNRVLTDTETLYVLAAALLVASRVRLEPRVLSGYRRAIAVTLWVSAASTVFALTTGSPLSGMQQGAAGSTDETERLISPATYFAGFVLAGFLVLWVAARVRARPYWYIWAPALLIVAVSFTRNTVLAIAVAFVLGVVLLGAYRRGVRVALAVAAAAGVVAAIEGLSVAALGPNWFSAQVDFFVSRVLVGLTPGAISADASALYRFDQENPYLIAAIRDKPVLGHGFGYAYRPLDTGRYLVGTSDALRYFAHDFYLWLLVKCGIAGAALFFSGIAYALAATLRDRRPLPIAVLATFAGCLVASSVAPMPLNTPTCALFGALAGVLVGAAQQAGRDGVR